VKVNDEDDGKVAPRVDLATFELGAGGARLVFWEAKHFNNKELRAAGDGPPPVIQQLKRYESYLSKSGAPIVDSYRNIAGNIKSLKAMGWQRAVSEPLRSVAAKALTLDPRVRLIIFGYDSAQSGDAGWKRHLQKFEDYEVAVLRVGEAKKARLP
jgi:hypothetical protein